MRFVSSRWRESAPNSERLLPLNKRKRRKRKCACSMTACWRGPSRFVFASLGSGCFRKFPVALLARGHSRGVKVLLGNQFKQDVCPRHAALGLVSRLSFVSDSGGVDMSSSEMSHRMVWVDLEASRMEKLAAAVFHVVPLGNVGMSLFSQSVGWWGFTINDDNSHSYSKILVEL